MGNTEITAHGHDYGDVNERVHVCFYYCWFVKYLHFQILNFFLNTFVGVYLKCLLLSVLINIKIVLKIIYGTHLLGGLILF